MKVLLNLTNDTLEYQDTKVFIQGTDARNQIIVYADEDITFTNLTIAYQLQNGRTTIAMANSGLVDSESDDYIEGYTGYIFNVPLSVTTLTGNIMATVVATLSGAKHKFNVLNTVIDSVFFEAYETALEEAESEFATDIEAMQSAIVQLQQEQALGVLHPSDIVDNDESDDPTKILSARMGKVLAERIGAATSGLVGASYNTETGILTLTYENDDTFTMKVGLDTEDIESMASDILADVNDDLDDYKAEVNQSLDDMTETIEGLGNLQPSGTDTSTNILAKTSAQGIWIGTDTGHWYYWDGTQYVDGGNYLSSAADITIDFNSNNSVANKAITLFSSKSFYSIDLLNLLQIGCHVVPTINNSKIQNDVNRAGFPYVIKIDKDDVIYVNTLNSNLAVEVLLIPLNYGTVSKIVDAWNTKKQLFITGYEGYILLNCGYFSNKTQTITSLDDLISNALLKVFSKEEKNIIKYTYGISYSGNLDSVSQTTTTGASQSDFIPVKEGDIYRISFLMSGKYSDSNASGITCFKENNLSSFIGFLAETDLITENVPSSKYLYVKDWTFAIPKGVNYISITARNNGLNNVATETLSYNEAFYSVFNSFEKIGSIENFSHESIDWVYGNPIGDDGIETTGESVWKTPLFRIPKNSQIYFPKQTFNNWSGIFFDAYYYDKFSNFVRKETNRKIIFASDDLYVRLVLKTYHGSVLYLVQYLKENKQSNVSLCLASLTSIGDCIAIKNNDTDKTIIIDTGQENAGFQMLQTIGANKIEAFIITHYHNDHAGYLSTFLNQPNLDFSETLFFIPPTPPQEYLDGDYPNDFNPTLYNSIQSLLNSPEYDGRVFKVDDLLYHTYFTDCGKIEFLNYDQSYLEVGTHYNNYSIVEKLTIDDTGKTILFTGDIEQEAQNHIKDSCNHIDVLKTPHHGFTSTGQNAIYNTSQDWLDNISAELFVSSSPSQSAYDQYYLDSAIIKYANVNNICNIMTGKVGMVSILFENGDYYCDKQSYYCPITIDDFSLIKFRN